MSLDPLWTLAKGAKGWRKMREPIESDVTDERDSAYQDGYRKGLSEALDAHPQNADAPFMVTDHEMRMEALRLFEENERLRKDLNNALEVLRSAYEIAQRKGVSTNWEAFKHRSFATILSVASSLSSQDRA